MRLPAEISAGKREEDLMGKIICIFVLITTVGYLRPINSADSLVEEPVPQIAFVSHDAICIINIDGTNLKCLTTDEARNFNPVWSPDGRFIAFHSVGESVGMRSSASASYIYDLENETTISLPQALYIYDWSPDSAFLLTAGSTHEGGDSEIYLLRSDGSGLQALTDNQVMDSTPAWSPDGTQIAYLSGFPEATLMVMSATGENLRPLTIDLAVNREVQPVWSPDSQVIAFVVDGEHVGLDQLSEIYIVHADGTSLRQLTNTGGVNLNPRWSPDGTHLVFYGYAPGAFDDVSDTSSLRTEVFLMNADGSDLVDLTQNSGLDYQPAWSPDGEWIAFASTRIWQSENPRGGIFIMRPDGSDLRMVTSEPPFNEGGREANSPVWRPIVQALGATVTLF
jgi:TolB protein